MTDVQVLGPPRRFGTRWSGDRLRSGSLRLSRISWADRAAIAFFVFVCLFALVGPWLAPHDPTARVGAPFLKPGRGGFLLGTDENGRDVWSRILFGVRSTWYATLAVLAITGVIGAVIGTVAGTVGGWLDTLLMRFVDLLLALPAPLIAIAVVAALGPSLQNTLIGISLVWWPWYARIVRNEVRAIGARPHVEAARLAGSKGFRLGRLHLFPGAVPPLIVTLTLDVSTLILTISALSFLGLGAQPPQPELGSMLAAGVGNILQYWWLPVIPSIAVTVLSFAGNAVGDSARALLEDR